MFAELGFQHELVGGKSAAQHIADSCFHGSFRFLHGQHSRHSCLCACFVLYSRKSCLRLFQRSGKVVRGGLQLFEVWSRGFTAGDRLK